MKIYDCGLTSTGGWQTPPTPQELIDNGYDGIYLMASKSAKDNIYITDYHKTIISWNEACKLDYRLKPLKIGFYIELMEGNVSYTNQIQDLAYKYNKAGLELPPAILFTGTLRTGHAVRGDLQTYLKPLFIDKFPVTVLGLSKSSKEKLLEPYSGDNINAFIDIIKRMKLWYFRWGVETIDPKEIPPFTEVYIHGISNKVNLIGEAPTPEPPIDEVSLKEQIKQKLLELQALVDKM